MFEYLEKNSEENIEIIEKLIDIHTLSLEKYGDNERQKIKQFYLSSTVTRLYAILENFIHVIISDYLDTISELVRYDDLPEKFKTEYRIGISHILSKLEQRRYKHLNHENLIEWYHSAIKNEENYKIIPDALTRHEENFRLNIIESLFGKIQLKEFNQWLNFNNHLISHFEGSENVLELLDTELKEFIQLRNDASHGNLDVLEGEDRLKNYCSLIKSLIKCISEFFRYSLLLLKVEKNIIQELGVITEVYKQANANILVAKQRTKIRLKDRVLLLSKGNCFYEEITSLQEDGVSKDELEINKVELEIGIKFKKLSVIGTKLYLEK